MCRVCFIMCKYINSLFTICCMLYVHKWYVRCKYVYTMMMLTNPYIFHRLFRFCFFSLFLFAVTFYLHSHTYRPTVQINPNTVFFFLHEETRINFCSACVPSLSSVWFDNSISKIELMFLRTTHAASLSVVVDITYTLELPCVLECAGLLSCF